MNMETLELPRKRLKRMLSEAQNIQTRIPTINRLPVEILGMIFTWLLPPHPPFSNIMIFKLGMKGIEYLNLSFVCRHWRQVVVSTPMLWTGIFYRVVGSYTPMTDPRISFVPLQLLRSGACPLNVTDYCTAVFVKPDNGVPGSPTPVPLVQMLMNNVHRIRRLSLWIDWPRNLTWTWREPAAQLETLEITCDNYFRLCRCGP
ncbi:hypothetical protein BDW22DRAFT_271515 [Trametopsis cervina]|nr:hypothetical protein BDW22DRAFT_271515 [Trametopsis cervina]